MDQNFNISTQGLFDRASSSHAVRHHPHRTHDPRSGSQDTIHPKTRCRKPYAATQHLMLLMMGLCT